MSMIKYISSTSSGYVKLSVNNKKSHFQDGVNIAECIDNFFKVFYDGFFYLFIGNHIYDKK